MSNLTTIPAIDGFETTLAQAWNGAVGTVYVDSIPASTFPSGEKTYIVVNPGKTNMQVARVSAWTTGQFTVDSVSVMKGSTSLAYSQQIHAVKSKVIISDNYQFWLDIQTAINSKLDANGGNTTTTFDLDLTGSAFRIRKDGSNMKFTDDNTPEVTLTTLASGGGADQKVAVTVSDTTTGTLDAKLTAGDGLKKTVITPGGAETLDLDIDLADTTVFVSTSSGAGDSGKLALLNASGQIPAGFINSKFGGNSADGVQGDANLTITGSNNTYITKNFSSWTAGSTTRTCTVTPTGCVVHIKIRGNADFTNWTFDFSGKGTAGGAGTSGGTATVGTATSLMFQLSSTGGGVPGSNITTGGGGGAGNGANGSAAGGAGGVKGNIFPLTAITGRRCIEIGCGSGGGGGGGNGTGGTGGTGGAGGGCLIIEVGGTTTLDNTLTVINMSGAVGSNATGGGAAGGGGGGGGGSVYIMYTGTLIGTCTPTVAGGAGGTGIGGSGGAGGVGLALIEQNVVFS